MDVTSLGLRTDLALLVAAGSTIEDCGDHLVTRSPYNPTHYWGNFLLLDYVPEPGSAAAWLARFEEALPDARHRTFAFDDTSAEPARLAGFADHGLRIERSTTLTTSSLTEPPRMNAEAIYRRLESDADWAQKRALQLACFDEYDESQEEFVVRRAESNRQLVAAVGGGWFGAFLDGQLVSQMGLVNAGSGLARFQSVETHPSFRERGLAGTLLHHVGSFGLGDLGARTLVIVADPDDTAIRLYEAVGFRATETTLQAERWPGWDTPGGG